MALQAVDLGANKEEEEAPYKTVMVTDRGQRSTLIGLDFKAGSDRERARTRRDGRAEHFVDSRALWGDPSFGQEGVCLSAAIWEKRSGEFFVAFVGLALVLFCCPAIP